MLLSVAGKGQRIMASLFSPDGQQHLEVGLNGQEKLCYRLLAGKNTVIDWSVLGLVTDDKAGIPSGKAGIGSGKAGIRSVGKVRHHAGNFAWPLGENDTIDNTYTELTVDCSAFGLELRLYNGAAAFRYTVPNAVAVRGELTEFRLPGPFTVYQYNQESVFTRTGTDTMRNTCDLPATLTDGRSYLSIGEADNDGYTKAELAAGNSPHSLRLVYPRDAVVNMAASSQTPWRTIGVAHSAIGLHAYSQLYLQLTPPAPGMPPAPGISPTIKPGKLIRSALTTKDGFDCIDFAAKHNFQYVLFDAGWYGAEFRSISDPTAAIPAIDMPAVIQHGKEKDIGIILYVNYVGLRVKLDTLLPLYKKWGVSGLKFGFVDGLTQKGITWLAAAVKKASDYGFILDIHDNYKPTGLSRRYPALLTQEGIRGDENSPDAFHTTTLPFTRFLAGPADFTFCYPNSKNKFTKNLKVTKAQQLALTVIYFSPLQSIFWYGKPGDYTDESEIEFFKYVPTVWNESRYLAGDIGRYISVARRHGETWFIGNAAGETAWQDSIRLDFLQPGKIYQATIYSDDGKQGLTKQIVRLKKGDRFGFKIAAGGGQAMILH
jgi:alpha-glucosidase